MPTTDLEIKILIKNKPYKKNIEPTIVVDLCYLLHVCIENWNQIINVYTNYISNIEIGLSTTHHLTFDRGDGLQKLISKL